MELEANLVVDARATLGEGPVWDDRRACLFWVDIDAGKLHSHDPQGEEDQVFELGVRVGAVVPSTSDPLILATADGFETFDIETGQRASIADPESHLPGNRFNDGKCDPAGRFWAGTMGLACEPDVGALYVMDRDRSVRCVRRNVSISNGLAWSPDHRTMYYIDTPTGHVTAFDFELATGALANERVIVEFPDGVGSPDGMCIDADGMLWIAHWGGGRVSRWDPESGEQMATIWVPAAQVTSCAFGGAAFDTLYITTARQNAVPNALEQQPHAGSLFCVRPPVPGTPATRFAG